MIVGWTYSTHTHTTLHIYRSTSITSSNFVSFQLFFRVVFRSGVKRDGTLVASPGPLLKRLADLDGRAVEVKGDSRVSVTRVLNSMKTNGI